MIPTFRFFHKHILECLNDDREHRKSDLYDFLIHGLSLSQEDVNAKTKGGQSKLQDRVSWSCAYLIKATAIERVKPGVYRITPLGKIMLNDNHQVIDNYLLAHYCPNFSSYQYIPKRGVNDKRYGPKSKRQKYEI